MVKWNQKSDARDCEFTHEDNSLDILRALVRVWTRAKVPLRVLAAASHPLASHSKAVHLLRKFAPLSMKSGRDILNGSGVVSRRRQKNAMGPNERGAYAPFHMKVDRHVTSKAKEWREIEYNDDQVRQTDNVTGSGHGVLYAWNSVLYSMNIDGVSLIGPTVASIARNNEEIQPSNDGWA
ncbi:hypothetical protein B0J17DRAFT_705796 [Rhizoctonia solani]|nr:hypothetical protein B0J17DRAFT_705796 [Rhizoctonia solani]